jgi:hypothetical protein
MRVCRNCGASDDLHHFETNQCPLGGVEAPIGQIQRWMFTTFDAADKELWELRDAVNKLTARVKALERLNTLQSGAELQESLHGRK